MGAGAVNDVGLTWVLDHQPLTLLVAVATFLVTALLYVVIPKGLFPTQDTGLIQGVTEASQTISLRRHGRCGSGGWPRRS